MKQYKKMSTSKKICRMSERILLENEKRIRLYDLKEELIKRLKMNIRIDLLTLTLSSDERFTLTKNKEIKLN